MSETNLNPYVDLEDNDNFGFLSPTDEIIIHATTLHYNIFSLKFIPNNDIVHTQHLLNYDDEFNDNLTGNVYMTLNEPSSDALIFIEENDGRLIQKSENFVEVRVYDPNKPGSRIVQINQYIQLVENSPLIQSVSPTKYN